MASRNVLSRPTDFYSFAVHAAYCLHACRLHIHDKTDTLRAGPGKSAFMRSCAFGARAATRPRPAAAKRSWIEILPTGKICLRQSGTRELIITSRRRDCDVSATAADAIVGTTLFAGNQSDALLQFTAARTLDKMVPGGLSFRDALARC